MTKINLNNIVLEPFSKKLSLIVEKGELLAVSGEGSKELLDVIAGFKKIDAGTYHLDYHHNETKDQQDLAAMRFEKIGYVPSQPELLEQMTFTQNIEFPYYFQTGARRMDAMKHQRIEQYSRLFGIQNLMPKNVDDLSEVQKKYLMLLRALFNSPAIIVLDAPFEHLDAQEKTTMLGMLKILKNEGITIIVSTEEEAIWSECSRHIIPFEIN